MNKIGLAPTSLANTPALEYIDAARRAGFAAIGMRFFRSPGLRYGFDPVVGDAARMREVQHALADSGMELLEVLSYYLQPEMDIDSMLPSLEFAAKLGARYALLIGDDPEWSRMVENFGRFCDRIAPLGMVAAIEAPVARRVLCSIPLTVRLIVDSGRQNASVCLDPLHFVEVGHTPDDLKGLDPRLFPYTQIRDGHVVNRLGSKFWRDEPHATGALPLGEGQVPLTEILDILPDGLPLSLEWSMPRDSTYSAAEWATHALQHTRQFLEQYHASRQAPAVAARAAEV
jgi:sugar phosphate isomerase/epimerase